MSAFIATLADGSGYVLLVDGEVVVKGTKSRAGTRVLPLDDMTVRALEALHDRQVTEAMEAGEGYEESGLVVCDELGGAIRPDRYSRMFLALAKLAGLPPIRLHDSRHTANSLMADAGIPDHIRAAWCGHRVEVNVATYTHASAAGLTAARDSLASVIGGTS